MIIADLNNVTRVHGSRTVFSGLSRSLLLSSTSAHTQSAVSAAVFSRQRHVNARVLHFRVEGSSISTDGADNVRTA